MSVDVWIGFAAGAATGFFIASVFASIKFWDLYQQNTAHLEHIKELTWERDDMRSRVEPRQWDDEWSTPILVKERNEKLYDKYPELVEPGTEVIRIDDLDDIHDVDDDPMGHKDWSYE